MFFGTSGVFEIQKIALESTQKNLQLTFGSYRSIFEDKDNAFKTSEFHVYLSKDGENWAEITYDRLSGTTSTLTTVPGLWRRPISR